MKELLLGPSSLYREKGMEHQCEIAERCVDLFLRRDPGGARARRMRHSEVPRFRQLDEGSRVQYRCAAQDPVIGKM
jgi:hypothetical protein